jgi:hypothetical protein
MELLLGKHALGQARERGISIKEIKKTIQQGAKHIQKPNKIVADYMHIRVVYRIVRQKHFVITVMIRK